MTTLQFLALCFLFLSAVAWLDYRKYTDNIPGNSITQEIGRAGKKYPIVAALVGYVLGAVSMGLVFHFFDSSCQ